ncbi:MAG: hypothetical protein FWG72_07265 [Oscillospiraceae bacterium]|nr:hypothetical protein [Oscillospiraceae bacterium]
MTTLARAKRWLPPLGVLALGLSLMALGLWRGESRELLQKAVTVCLECIGIG